MPVSQLPERIGGVNLMELCYNRHDEICYEGRQCPICDLIKDKDMRIEQLETTVSDLEETIRELEAEQD